MRSFDQMAIADRDLDREKKIAIDDQKITDHSYLDYFPNISIVHMKFSFEFVIYARSLAKSGIKSARVKKVSFIDHF